MKPDDEAWHEDILSRQRAIPILDRLDACWQDLSQVSAPLVAALLRLSTDLHYFMNCEIVRQASTTFLDWQLPTVAGIFVCSLPVCVLVHECYRTYFCKDATYSTKIHIMILESWTRPTCHENSSNHLQSPAGCWSCQGLMVKAFDSAISGNVLSFLPVVTTFLLYSLYLDLTTSTDNPRASRTAANFKDEEPTKAHRRKSAWIL